MEVIWSLLEEDNVHPNKCRSLLKKFPTYKEFANANLQDILGSGLDSGAHYQVKEFRSLILNNNKGKFTIMPMPKLAQFSPYSWNTDYRCQ